MSHNNKEKISETIKKLKEKILEVERKSIKALCVQSVHLIFGFSQIPRTHSLEQTGEYPFLPVFLFSQNFGKTSVLQTKSFKKRSIFSSGVVGIFEDILSPIGG